MPGTWETQNKVLPGAYINLITNTPLSVTAGSRGVVVIPQELSVGAEGTIYTITATEANYPEGATAADKKLVNVALLGAQKVLLYKLPSNHTDDHIEAMLEKLKTEDFNVLAYPYEKSTTSASTAKQIIATWIKAMEDEEGKNVTAALMDYAADSEYVISSNQGVTMSDGSTLTAAETVAWVGGVTAGAKITESNTAKKFVGAIDVSPRMTKSEKEAAVKAGKFILDVDKSQNVTVVADINTLTSTTQRKGSIMKQNRSVRTACGIREDIDNLWVSSVNGKYDNDPDGQTILKTALIDYFNGMARRKAINGFDSDKIVIADGVEINAVTVDVAVRLLGSMEFAYINVNLNR
jgi:hypothetical protein